MPLLQGLARRALPMNPAPFEDWGKEAHAKRMRARSRLGRYILKGPPPRLPRSGMLDAEQTAAVIRALFAFKKAGRFFGVWAEGGRFYVNYEMNGQRVLISRVELNALVMEYESAQDKTTEGQSDR